MSNSWSISDGFSSIQVTKLSLSKFQDCLTFSYALFGDKRGKKKGKEMSKRKKKKEREKEKENPSLISVWK